LPSKQVLDVLVSDAVSALSLALSPGRTFVIVRNILLDGGGLLVREILLEVIQSGAQAFLQPHLWFPT
jgi:hypothetical protein